MTACFLFTTQFNILYMSTKATDYFPIGKPCALPRLRMAGIRIPINNKQLKSPKTAWIIAFCHKHFANEEQKSINQPFFPPSKHRLELKLQKYKWPLPGPLDCKICPNTLTPLLLDKWSILFRNSFNMTNWITLWKWMRGLASRVINN